MEYAYRAYHQTNDDYHQPQPSAPLQKSNNSSKIHAMAKSSNLVRGFSKTKLNESIFAELRARIEKSLIKTSIVCRPSLPPPVPTPPVAPHLVMFLLTSPELSQYNFMLPELNSIEDPRFKDFLQNELIELPTQYNLTESGHLNWWSQGEWEDVCRPLYPMVTSGDGNCLLHACSLSMWGMHDRSLVLRRALHSSMQLIKADNSCPIWRRWRWEQMCDNCQYELVLSEEEWEREWCALIGLSTDKPRTSTHQQQGATGNAPDQSPSSPGESLSSTCTTVSSNTIYFESLEHFHVFLLAHILQRPIIVIADRMLRDMNGTPMSPIKFGGIYLPLECDPAVCHRFPLVLAYDSAHFSPLLQFDYYDEEQKLRSMSGHASASTHLLNELHKRLQIQAPLSIVPLTYSNRELMPVHFAYDPGPSYDWSRFPHKPGTYEYIHHKSIFQSAGEHQPNELNSNAANALNVDKELSLAERMNLLQRHLDLVKVELTEPGALSKRGAYVTNSSGMKVSIQNVKVSQEAATPVAQSAVDSSNNSNSTKSSSTTQKATGFTKTMKKLMNNVLKKKPSGDDDSHQTDNSNNFVTNIDLMPEQAGNNRLRKSFKASSSGSGGSNGLFKTLKPNGSLNNAVPTPLSYNKIDTSVKSGAQMPNAVISTSGVFHKQVSFKSWDGLMDSVESSSHGCLLCVKLNLIKTPKYTEIVDNYLDTAREKYDMIVEQINQQQQSQQQASLQNAASANKSVVPHYVSSLPSTSTGNTGPVMIPIHHCPFNKSDCTASNLCSECSSQETTLRSVTVSSSSARSSTSEHQLTASSSAPLSNSSNNLNTYSYNAINAGRSSNSSHQSITTTVVQM